MRFFDQVQNNNRTIPINRTHNWESRDALSLYMTTFWLPKLEISADKLSESRMPCVCNFSEGTYRFESSWKLSQFWELGNSCPETCQQTSLRALDPGLLIVANL